MKKFKILSPVSGKVLPITSVPDGVFSEKILGDGVAVMPTDGKIYSPVDGVVDNVAETLHAYGFRSDDGIDVLVHFGLDTVNLKGEGFKSFVKQGDRVKAGDLVAEVDVELLKKNNINLITPVVICGNPECELAARSQGEMISAKDCLIELVYKKAEQAEKESTSKKEPNDKSKKQLVNFDALQKLGKVLMVVIAVMPAAGFAISIGKLISMFGGDVALLSKVGAILENIGWTIISNLHILFAVAIGGSWAKERAGGAFAAVIAFALINSITGQIFGVTSDMLNDPSTVTTTLFGQEIAVNGYFTSVLGAPALNMGVFVGIIAGFVGGIVYNKYYNFRRLPDALSFFNGKRFVPIVVILWSVIVSLILAVVWPFVQMAINSFGIWIANSQSKSPILAPFIYGTLERLLLPFGLHHMLTIPMNYTSFGGEYIVQTGVNAGTTVFGQDPLWLAWITDLINFKEAGDMVSYNRLIQTVVPARFKVGQMIGSTGLLLGVALAMYHCVDKDRKHRYKSMFISTALTVFLTGVTEPIEFMFMFCAIPLYVVYSLLQGLAFASAGILSQRLHSFGSIELATRLPMAIKAGIGMDIINFLIMVVLFFVIGYFVSRFMIQRFHYATPGRLGNYQNDSDSSDGEKKVADGQTERIIALLGGRENISLVDACMTRLRVTVKNPELVASVEDWKKEGAMSLMVKGTGVQAVYGPKADIIKSDINDAL